MYYSKIIHLPAVKPTDFNQLKLITDCNNEIYTKRYINVKSKCKRLTPNCGWIRAIIPEFIFTKPFYPKTPERNYGVSILVDAIV